MKGCNVCHEEIQDAATFCVHCKNHQSALRRSIASTQVTAAALIAVISLFTLSSPILMRQLSLDQPKLAFYVVQFSRTLQSNLVLGIRNTGSADGLLTDVRLSCPTSTSSRQQWQRQFALVDGESPVVPAYSSKVVAYQINHEEITNFIPLNTRCSIQIVHDFLNDDREITLSLPSEVN